MLGESAVLQTKLTPPRRHRRVLPRPTLVSRLAEALDLRLTIVQAHTGYGKSTALAEFADQHQPHFWLNLDDSDSDPQRFLLHLISAFQLGLPLVAANPLALLHETTTSNATYSQVLTALINALAQSLNQPALLILDDYHFVADTPEVSGLINDFLNHMPPNLHVILATRYPPNLPNLPDWRLHGDLLEIDSTDLAFQPPEIDALFARYYDLHLTAEEVAALAERTEGWPIALQMVWQGMRSGETSSLTELLNSAHSSSVGALFDYLARNVLHRLPPNLAHFLRQTAVLRTLSPAACNAVTQTADGAALLERLLERDLFIIKLAEGQYRYQHLFHDFLREQLADDPATQTEGHLRAARHYRHTGLHSEAIYHWLAAHAYTQAAQDIIRMGEAALAQGRLSTLAAWLDALPPDILADHPMLLNYQGDLCRLSSRFDDARAWYAAAEHTWRVRGDMRGVSAALRGQARVYLDTVRPADAEALLQQAEALIDGTADRQARARLFELIAENKLNMGKPHEAETLLDEARLLRDSGPTQDVLNVRVKLRTGRLDEAEKLLLGWLAEERSAAEQGQAHAPRAHRETSLILALINAFKGQAEPAFALAQEGIEAGQKLGSPFVTAVGHMRLGHAWQLQPNPDQPDQPRQAAIKSYQSAVALGDQLSVRRIRAEAMWGLTRAYGFYGDLAAANRAAAEGMEIGRWAGDPWITALNEMTLGASHILADQPSRAIDILARALQTFRDCADPFGQAATRMWLSLAYLEDQQFERLNPSLDDLFNLVQAHNYDVLFTRATLLGPPDPRRLAPLLIYARAQKQHRTEATRLLTALGLANVELHPGYQLRVQTLGRFRVWRGSEEIGKGDWRREKARQLFQLFLTHYGRMLDREQLVDMLWPDLDPETARRDFKVALNSLYKVLEPRRQSGAASAFIDRQGTNYGLRTDADLWIDAHVFEHHITTAEDLLAGPKPNAPQALSHLQAALNHYQGSFLQEHPYDEWSLLERERLQNRYLRAADRTAELMLANGDYQEAIALCELILIHDNCWERAYFFLMQAYVAIGNRAQALRIYQRCHTTLQNELATSPSPYLRHLHAQLLAEPNLQS